MKRIQMCVSTGCLALSALAGNVTVKPEATTEPLINPDMGLVYYHNAGRLWAYGAETPPGDTLDWFPGVSTIYFRMNWCDLEPREGEYHWEIIDSVAQPWIARGKKLAFRIACSMQTTNAVPEYVREAGAKGAWFDYPPADWNYGPVERRFWEPVFDDPVFLAKYEKFLRAFAARYDGDDSVAFVDIGSYGLFGEGHTGGTVKLNDEETARIVRIHFDLHRRVLPRTQLIISHSVSELAILNRATDHPLLKLAREMNIGFRNDSVFCYGWGPCQSGWTDARWGRLFAPELPVVIETGHWTTTHENGFWKIDQLLPCAEAYQASYFSIHGYPRKMLEENPAVYAELARRVGYRFELREASWPSSVKVGEPVAVDATWVNVGVTWCHQPAFAAWTLLDENDTVVWTCVDEKYDFRQTYPKIDGIDTWDFVDPGARQEGREWKTKVTSTCRFGFDVPSLTNDHIYVVGKQYGMNPPEVLRMLKRGEYTLAVSIGSRQGTPKIALPLRDQVGESRRYRLGRITVK